MRGIQLLIDYLGNMKVKVYRVEKPNTGLLEQTNKEIIVRNGRWIDWNGTSHPMNYKRIRAFENRRVYYLFKFGSGKTGYHISLSYAQNQRFLFLQNDHWFQQPDNIKWVVGAILIGGAGLALNYYKFFAS